MSSASTVHAGMADGLRHEPPGRLPWRTRRFEFIATVEAGGLEPPSKASPQGGGKLVRKSGGGGGMLVRIDMWRLESSSRNQPGTLAAKSPGASDVNATKPLVLRRTSSRAGDRGRTGDVQLGKLAFYH